jgi:hypothetical protein
MNPIKAMVRNGRIETDQPLNLPDGTPLLVLRSEGAAADAEDPWDNTPEGIAAWLKWYDSLEPLIFSPEEKRLLAEDRATRKEWELSHFEERAHQLRRSWE